MTKIKFFAGFREKIGRTEVELHIENATLSEVISILDKQVKGFKKIMEEGNVVIAVNHEVADSDTAVHNEDEIAIFPPVSGG